MTSSTETARQHTAAHTPGHSPHLIHLFDAGALQRRVMGLPLRASHQQGGQDCQDPVTGLISVPVEGENLDDGEQRRRDWHCKMLNHPMGPVRKLIQPSKVMLPSIAYLGDSAPHFSDVLEFIARAIKLGIATRTPLRLPPILLVGEPGIGKTWFLKRLAACLQTDSLFLAMNCMSDRGTMLTGLSPAWKASAPGKIAKILIEGQCASPIIVMDEIDKISPINPAETPLEVLHSLLEAENAKAFTDEFLDVGIDASHVIWFASANDISDLSASILDRFVIFNIEVDDAHRRRIHESVFDAVNAQYGNRFSLESPDVLDAILDRSPRAMTRFWPAAFGVAAELGCRHIGHYALEAVDALLIGSSPAKAPMGFINTRPGTAKHQERHAPQGQAKTLRDGNDKRQ